jgi:hypothetical protein
MGAVDRVPWKQLEIEDIDETEMGRLFALEVGGARLMSFRFPNPVRSFWDPKNLECLLTS